METPSDGDTVVSGQTPSLAPSEWDNVYDSLKDDTRAVKAFVLSAVPHRYRRRPVDILFDIAKGHFQASGARKPRGRATKRPSRTCLSRFGESR